MWSFFYISFPYLSLRLLVCAPSDVMVTHKEVLANHCLSPLLRAHARSYDKWEQDYTTGFVGAGPMLGEFISPRLGGIIFLF